MTKTDHKLTIGTPVKPMLVKESGNSQDRYSDIMKAHNYESFTEVKSDGYRVQIHRGDEISLYTRNLNSLNPEVFPEIEPVLRSLPYGIFDGELVGVDDGIKGFNAIKARKRETLDKDLVKQFPLQLKFFDVLNLNGIDTYSQPLSQRRKTLEQYCSNTSDLQIIEDAEDLEERFTEVTEDLGLEGLVCKNPDSAYQIGARNSDWIKLKKFLTLDLVVLGLYKGEGKYSNLPFAALLLGTKNNGVYETLTKVGLANTEKIEAIYQKVKPFLTDKPTDNTVISPAINKNSNKRKIPFTYIQPDNSAVVEVETMNVTRSKNWHSCGLSKSKNDKAYSLRIPVVREVRNDKKPADSTTTQQISELFVE